MANKKRLAKRIMDTVQNYEDDLAELEVCLEGKIRRTLGDAYNDVSDVTLYEQFKQLQASGISDDPADPPGIDYAKIGIEIENLYDVVVSVEDCFDAKTGDLDVEKVQRTVTQYKERLAALEAQGKPVAPYAHDVITDMEAWFHR